MASCPQSSSVDTSADGSSIERREEIRRVSFHNDVPLPGVPTDGSCGDNRELTANTSLYHTVYQYYFEDPDTIAWSKKCVTTNDTVPVDADVDSKNSSTEKEPRLKVLKKVRLLTPKSGTHRVGIGQRNSGQSSSSWAEDGVDAGKNHTEKHARSSSANSDDEACNRGKLPYTNLTKRKKSSIGAMLSSEKCPWCGKKPGPAAVHDEQMVCETVADESVEIKSESNCGCW